MNDIKHALLRKFGPLPAWLWATIGGGALYLYRRHQAAAAAAAGTSTTAAAPAAAPADTSGYSAYGDGGGYFSGGGSAGDSGGGGGGGIGGGGGGNGGTGDGGTTAPPPPAPPPVTVEPPPPDSGPVATPPIEIGNGGVAMSAPVRPRTTATTSGGVTVPAGATNVKHLANGAVTYEENGAIFEQVPGKTRYRIGYAATSASAPASKPTSSVRTAPTTTTAPPPSKPRPPVTQTPPHAPAPPAVHYYTYKKDVPLKPGQTLHFTSGRGYYAA